MIQNVKTVIQNGGRYLAIIKVKENKDWCKGCYLERFGDCNMECRSAGGKFRKIKDGDLLKMTDGTIQKLVVPKDRYRYFELKEVCDE